MKSPLTRKEENIKRLRGMGVAVLEQLPLIEGADEVQLRSFDEICERAVAALLATQIACDAAKGNYEEGMAFFPKLIKNYGVTLSPTEQKLLEGNFTKRDVLNISWEYECLWALYWALGLVEDITDTSGICDCDRAIHLVADCQSMREFKEQCNPRGIEEILDVLDFFYRAHWACTEHRLRPETPIGNLNGEVVTERRRGLEWLISDPDEIDDWFDISLDT